MCLCTSWKPFDWIARTKWSDEFLLCVEVPTVYSPCTVECLLQEKLTLTDMGILMTAAVCHDLDHPGYNNT